MNTVWLVTTHIYKDAEVELERCIELPFAPYEGLFLHLDRDRDEQLYLVNFAEYFVEDACWVCNDETHDNVSCCGCNQKGRCCFINKNFRENFAEAGWTVSRVLRGRKREFLVDSMVGPRPAQGIKLSGEL